VGQRRHLPASIQAGVGSPLFLGVLKGITGSFVLPLVITGGVAILGAVSYAFIVGRVEPLPFRQQSAMAS